MELCDGGYAMGLCDGGLPVGFDVGVLFAVVCEDLLSVCRCVGDMYPPSVFGLLPDELVEVRLGDEYGEELSVGSDVSGSDVGCLSCKVLGGRGAPDGSVECGAAIA